MSLRQTIFDIKSFFSVHWNLNRRLFMWLGFFVLIGITIGLITIFNPAVTAPRIGRNFIDTNILRSISTRATFGSFIIARLIEFILSAIFIFILCQTGITSLFSFAFISFRACTMTINLYWIIARLGIMGGGLLFIFYLIFFLLLLATFAAIIVFIMKQCAAIRSYGFRRGICWRNFCQVMFIFTCIITFIAILEWLCFWLIFSKILWPAVFTT